MDEYRLEIEKIIFRSRHFEEGLLIDEKLAAKEIIKLLTAAGFEKDIYLKVA